MGETVFSKILNKELPAKIVHEDELCMAICDINPRAPTHILIIPRKPIRDITEVEDEDKELLGHLICVARDIAKQNGLDEKGFRLVVNTGISAGQTVFHLHVHLMGGRTMAWPPG